LTPPLARGNDPAMRISTPYLAASVLCFAACASIPTDDIKTEANADKSVNFAMKKTYAFAGSIDILNDPNGRWKPKDMSINDEIRFLIEAQLRDHGLRPSEAQPDVEVLYGIVVDMEAQKQQMEGSGEWASFMKNVPLGALIVQLRDASTGKPVWMGAATGELQSETTPEFVQKRLAYAVNKIFKDYPATAK
jgi:hypothetical protein